MPNPSPVIDQAERLKRAALKREVAELSQLVQAFRAVHDRAQALANGLTLDLLALDNPTPAQVQRMRRYRQLIAETGEQIAQYSTYVGVEAQKSARLAVAMGEKDARLLTAVAGGNAKLAGSLRALSPETIVQLVGFLDPKGPLYKRLGNLPAWTSEQVANAIIEGVGLGRNPRTIAAAITRTLGMGLTSSLTTIRTVQLWSYREASRASYIANADVVRGWVWYASLDDSTCPSCWAEHGTTHELGEPLNDHHNGRCAALPWVIGTSNPVGVSGEQAFRQLSEEKQRAILGGGRYDAYKAGAFEFPALSSVRTDEVYGPMRTAAPLAELVGEQP